VRASIYPILPTTDYTPLPADPAAVYKPTTLQLLDIPGNDAVGLGIGTEDPLVPAEGIGGEARSTSSCNPGCWEDLYELVDLQLNGDRPQGFVNPTYGSLDLCTVLPDDTVPMFIVIGDSTCQGLSVTPPATDAEVYKAQTAYWPKNAFDGSTVGYFWDKFMTSVDGESWVKSYPDYLTADTSGNGFLPLHPRLGGISYGPFAYSDPLDPNNLQAVGNCSPVWDFALEVKNIFRKSSGEILPPHYIMLGAPQTRLGSNGPDYPDFPEFNFSPSGGFLYNTLLQAYIKPAVDEVMNQGKNPLLVGLIILQGGSETFINYNPNPDGDKVVASGAQTYINFIEGLKESTKVGGDYPWLAYTIWDTFEPTNYPIAFSQEMRKQVQSLANNHKNRFVNLGNLRRDKLPGDPGANGVHFLQKEYPRYGKRFGHFYKSLLSMRRYPLYGRTLSDIFDEQY